MRWILPRAVIINSSSSSCTRAMPITWPFRLVVLMSRSPLPPRRCVRYLVDPDVSSSEVSLLPESPSSGPFSLGPFSSGPFSLGPFSLGPLSSEPLSSARVLYPKVVRLPYPFSHDVNRVASGSATTIPTRSSPLRNEIPLTPDVLRPIDRASASLKRMAIPCEVASTTSSPGLVTTTSTSSSSSRNLMAIMPPRFGRL